ncbi:16S rRNA (cytidine(1402)-2'-O)-methyltransferase [Vagococcus intermedius]|uniref:Ribosomal RNA small subunit methyltransferase I n=1 Tax=Vagococcus intermedius TaxID=2991418 RepID=A0AAF0CWX1_9ENTE|nr:16S rRNA (cytidine(1402)-2'-O)-methyltransferase [Vagococcus intermedius]WEG74331.1 16S rRNA (cytidine(1402)-2'-O)-methyltransferase [Vagococcus intermedius]WEG76413.1 16S rRNA (cytidine(1402)-2'-O)-methyltransferase [Vagococcus intermedius]
MNKQKSFDKLKANEGALYLVPTPIGNLQDMTYRAIDMLHKASIIASEDTRNTQKLLNHFEIKTPQISFHDHNFRERIPELIGRMLEGEMIAQVSDAGMPSISDPGHELVVACIEADISVVALPGATAGVTALVASGLPADQFTFYGFLPRKKSEQLTELTKLKDKLETTIFYESPYRVKTTFMNMATVFGDERPAVLCRELTKLHEEYLRGTLLEIATYLEENDIKGECCILVGGISESQLLEEEQSTWEGLNVLEHIEEVMQLSQVSSKEAIKKVAKLRGLKKQEVYSEYHQD